MPITAHRSPIWRHNDPTHRGRCKIIFRLISDFTIYYTNTAATVYRSVVPVTVYLHSRELPKRAEFLKNWVFFRFLYSILHYSIIYNNIVNF